MKLHIPRHRPAGLRRAWPVLLLLVVAAGVVFALAKRPATTGTKAKGSTQVSLRRDATSPIKPAATPEPRKQRARGERRTAPELKV